MRKLNRRGNWAFFGLTLGVFVAAGIILINLNQASPNVEFIGETAATVLQNAEKQQTSFLQIDQKMDRAARSAAKRAVNKDFIKNETGCRQLGYRIIETNCEQAPRKVFKEILDDELSIVSNQLPDHPDLTLSSTVTDDWQISYESSTGLTYTIDEQTKLPTPETTSGKTAFGEATVSVTDLPATTCEKQSCTGYTKQCKPTVYDQLEDVADYAEQHGYQLIIESSTRTVEMQKFFYDQSQYCEEVKKQRCNINTDNPSIDTLNQDSCRQKYIDVLQDNEQDNRLACRPNGKCAKACNPFVKINGERQPNPGCTHMTGNAVDINLLVDGQKITDQENGVKMLRRTMCEFGFVGLHTEPWHYEYGSKNWKELRSADQLKCKYGGGPTRDWEQIPMIHEDAQ